MASEISNEELAKFIVKTWSLTSTQLDNDRNTSAVSSSAPSSEEDIAQPIPESQILQNYIQKYCRALSAYSSRFSATVGESDFQPSSFLRVGVDRSSAVCRIVIDHSSESLKKVIEGLKIGFETLLEGFPDFKDPETLKNHGLSFPEELGLIFSIPASSMTEFFGEPPYNKSFLESLECLEQKLDRLLTLNPFPLGTGFLVGDRYLLTNCHVLHSREIAGRCSAQFSYEDGFNDGNTVNYDFDPESLFAENSELDYTLIQLKPNAINKRHAGYKFGWLDLIESGNSILPPLTVEQVDSLTKSLKKDGYLEDDLSLLGLKKGNSLSDSRVAIIQHPRGRKKEIVLQNNQVIGLTYNYADYEADTDYGSSGSPVFNSKWEVVAITRKVIPKENSDKNQPTTTPNVTSKIVQRGVFGSPRITEWIASRGTRTCRIVEDLKRRSFRDSKLQNFIEDFVITSEQLNYPPLSAALKLDGLKDCIQIDVNSTTKDTSQAFSVEAWVNLTGQQEKSTIFTAFCRETWAEEESTLGDLVLHCYLTPEGELVVNHKKVFSSYPASSLLYPASRLDLFYPKRYPAPPSLRVGEKGTWIRAFKKFVSLIPKLELNLEETDISSEDAEVIKNFQSSAELPQDGIVNYKTLDALWKAIRFDQDSTPSPAIKDIRYLLTLINAGLKEPFPEAMLEGLRQPSEEFCEQTKAAVELFQKDLELKVTGAIDPITLDALWTYGLSLREGNQAQSVKDLQSLLNRFEHKVPITGIFDKDTVEAVKQFQECNRIVVDGVVEQRTLDALLLRAQKLNRSADKEEFIKKFQKDHDLAPDGLIGPLTDSAMMREKEKEKVLLGVYSHVAVIYDGETVRLLVNGKELIFSRKENVEPSIPTHFLIGAYAEVPERIAEDRSYYFQGSLADLRIWNRAETELKLNRFQRLIGDEGGLIGYWRFEEALEAKDQAENDLSEPQKLSNRVTNGKLTANLYGKPRPVLATQFPALPLGFAKEFKEPNSELEFPDFQLAKTAPQPITFEAWVQYNFGNGFILDLSDTEQNGVRLGFQDERLFVEFQGGGKRTRVEMESCFPVDMIWHHVAITLNIESEIWIYLDGRIQPTVVEYAEETKSIVIQGRRRTIGKFNAPIDVKSCSLFIGKRKDPTSYFHIAIAEVRIWKTARTQDQIKELQFSRLTGDDKDLLAYWRLDDGGQDNLVRDSSPYKRDSFPYKKDGRGATSWSYPAPPASAL